MYVLRQGPEVLDLGTSQNLPSFCIRLANYVKTERLAQDMKEGTGKVGKETLDCSRHPLERRTGGFVTSGITYLYWTTFETPSFWFLLRTIAGPGCETSLEGCPARPKPRAIAALCPGHRLLGGKPRFPSSQYG